MDRHGLCRMQGDRKVDIGGVIMLGSRLVKSWPSTQSVIELSSREAEYYGMVRGVSQALGMRSLLADLGIDMGIRLRTGSSAAKGIASRLGLGKVRHVEVARLRVQEKARSGEIRLEKVDRKKHIADSLTKHVNGDQLKWHMSCVSPEVVTGRHELAPEANS